MNSEAKDLRDLAKQIEALVRGHRANSIAWPQVIALTDYLTLRARVIEMTGELHERERERI